MRVIDTYALMEIFLKNEKFSYLLSEDIQITNITMAEFWGVAIRRTSKTTADYWLKKLRSICIGVSLDIHIKARDFKLTHTNKNFSIIDCIGYMQAKENNQTFVTGECEFEDLPNVEYIKK